MCKGLVTTVSYMKTAGAIKPVAVIKEDIGALEAAKNRLVIKIVIK